MKIIISTLLSFIMLVGCTKDRIQGSGTITGELRQLTGFKDILVEGDFEVFVKKGTTHRVEVKTDNNVQAYVVTELRDNSTDLLIRYKNQANVKPSFLEVYIEMPVVEEVDLSGSGKIIFSTLDFNLQNLKTELKGSGLIELRGTADNLDVDVEGSGVVEGFLLQAKEAVLEINGSGEIETSVSDKINAEINGSGKILYKGNPVVVSDISGSGKIVKVN